MCLEYVPEFALWTRAYSVPSLSTEITLHCNFLTSGIVQGLHFGATV